MHWKDAWWLTKKEIKYHWQAFLSTFLATIFIALFTVSLLEGYVSRQLGEKIYYSPFLLDFMFVLITVSFGALFMSSPYLSFRTIKEDPFSKRIAFYRTLPIPVEVLALSRTLLMLSTFVIMSITFYCILFIALSANFFQYLSTHEFLIFMVFWLSYSLAFSGLNPYIEFGTSGRFLHINMPLLVLGTFIVVKLIFHFLVGQGIVEVSIMMIKQYGWTPALIMLIGGLVGSYTWNSLLKLRLLKRDYL